MKRQDVINYFGTQDKAAKSLGITQAAISKWPDDVPHLRAIQVEWITKGALRVSTSEQLKKIA